MSSREPSRLWSALPVAVAIATFGIGLAGGFVLDDELAIVRNPVVRGDTPGLEAFARTFWGYTLNVPPASYRPIASLSFRLDHTLFGLSAVAFHVSSLVAYVALVGVCQVFARRFLDRRTTAISIAIFAAMPVHVENVSSLVGRADTISVLFATLGLLLAHRFARINRPRGVSLGAVCTMSLVLFTLALLAKESAFVWPIVVGLVTMWPQDAREPRRWHWGRGSFAASWLAIAVAYFVARMIVMPDTFTGTRIDDDVLRGSAPWTRMAFCLDVLGHYTRLLVAPVDLCTGRKYAMIARPDGLTLDLALGAVVIGAVIAHTGLAWRRARPPWLACALITWSVYAHVLFSVPEAMADRFMLGPSLFICLAFGEIAAGALRRPAARVVATAFLICECAASAYYATRWHDTETLLAHAVVACPQSAHNRFRYARHLADRGEIDTAIWNFAVAAQIRHHFPLAYALPFDETEHTLTPRERVTQMHALLAVEMPESAWRTTFIRLMLQQRLPALARRIADTSPVPISASSPPTP